MIFLMDLICMTQEWLLLALKNDEKSSAQVKSKYSLLQA